jgi:hypothetical protein
MTIKASGRSALISALSILAFGLFAGLAGPSQAAAGADDANANSKPETAAAAPVAADKSAAQHSKKYAHRKSGKLAQKSSDGKKSTATETAADNSSTMPSSEIPLSVANANAQLTSGDIPTRSARAMSMRANNILQASASNPAGIQLAAETQVVSADQLNDVDRALQEGNATAATPPTASADARIAESRDQGSTWDKTSLIGKIFIGFGVLLTMASAARMFMA